MPGELLALFDDYCDDRIDPEGLAELEAILRAEPGARGDFVEYLQLHAELGFSARARRAASAALSRFEKAEPVRPRWIPPTRWMAAAALVLASTGFGLGSWAWWSSRPAGADAREPVAWLLNAQDCRWAGGGEPGEPDGGSPGRDMRAGKVLRLERGLAEVEFERGARVILKGPARLELISGNAARLYSGSMTAKVPPSAHGFSVDSPQGHVVDLGTEFGLAVEGDAASGTTSVHVFSGTLTARPNGRSGRVVTLGRDQGARIDGQAVAVEPAGGPGAREPAEAKFARAIVPPPEIRERRQSSRFTGPVSGSLLDAEGRGTGLTSRLPGTGTAWPGSDPNLRIRPERGALELTTTRSDLNKQVGLDGGEYVGFRLADLGFTGREDFTISALVPNIPGLEVVGQFGLYAGARGNSAIRGGAIRQPGGHYNLFLVNNAGGIDSDLHEVGLTRIGDDLRFTLRRVRGAYSLLVENLTDGSSSQLAIAAPRFLEAERDLHVGFFGANTQSEVRKTLTIQQLEVTVWSETPGTAASNRALASVRSSPDPLP
jgi:hypothetical protein